MEQNTSDVPMRCNEVPHRCNGESVGSPYGAEVAVAAQADSASVEDDNADLTRVKNAFCNEWHLASVTGWYDAGAVTQSSDSSSTPAKSGSHLKAFE